MKSIQLINLLPATTKQPIEICLTLYFEVTSQVGLHDPLTRVQELLSPEVGGWAEVRRSSNEIIFQSVRAPRKMQSAFLISFTPQLTLHTKAIQVVLNVLGSASVAWQLASQWLYEQLYPVFTIPSATYLGYTVVYKATVSALPDASFNLDCSILKAIRWVHKPESVTTQSVISKQSINNKGYLFLVDSPAELGQGLIYVALGLKDELDFSTLAFIERDSFLTRIDTFIHKSLIQFFELNSIYDQYELKVLEPLSKSIDAVFNYVQNETLKSIELKELAKQVADQRQFYSDLDRLERSLGQQFNGLKRIFSANGKEGLPELPRHYFNLIESYREETQALVQRNRILLETARTALAMVEAQESKRTNDSQDRFNLTVAMVGIFLAAEQILDSDFAKHLLEKIGQFQTTTDDLFWKILLTRTGSSLIITLVVYIISKVLMFLRK